MLNLLELPSELQQRIMYSLDAYDLGRLRKTCKTFHVSARQELGVALLLYEQEIRRAMEMAESWRDGDKLTQATSIVPYFEQIEPMERAAEEEMQKEVRANWQEYAKINGLRGRSAIWAAHRYQAHLPCLDCLTMKPIHEFPSYAVKPSTEDLLYCNLSWKDIRRWNSNIAWDDIVRWQSHDTIKSERQCGKCRVKDRSKEGAWIELGPWETEAVILCPKCKKMDQLEIDGLTAWLRESGLCRECHHKDEKFEPWYAEKKALEEQIENDRRTLSLMQKFENDTDLPPEKLE